jgi:hypothetical protein
LNPSVPLKNSSIGTHSYRGNSHRGGFSIFCPAFLTPKHKHVTQCSPDLDSKKKASIPIWSTSAHREAPQDASEGKGKLSVRADIKVGEKGPLAARS